MIKLDLGLTIAVIIFIAGTEIAFLGMATDKKEAIKLGVWIHVAALIVIGILLFNRV